MLCITRMILSIALSLVLLYIHNIEAAPSVKNLTGSFGSFSTPNFPAVYEDNLDLEWDIKVRAGYQIKIQFTTFDLEDSYEPLEGACIYDYVKIIEGNKTLAKFCGNNNYDAPHDNQWITTQSDEAKVIFVSDYSNEYITPKGFQAHYIESDINECERMKLEQDSTREGWDELVFCNHYCHNVPGSYYCSCRIGFTLHANKHTCYASFCENQIITNETGGVITSPEYPQPYAKLSDCSWIIRFRVGMSVNLIFDNQFDIEEHFEERCAYDWLKISSGGTVNDYCGKSAPGNGLLMPMNDREVKLELHTDLSVEKTGFSVRYSANRIRCLQMIKNPENGQVTFNHDRSYHEFEDIATFSCVRGYKLSGNTQLHCQNDGTWNHLVPTCQIKSCGVPTKLQAVPNSHIEDYDLSKTTYLEILTVKCNEWYEMTSGYSQWICEDSKQWEKHGGSVPGTIIDIPVCKPICGIKGAEDNPLLAQQISDGDPVKKHEWPWLTLLNFGSEPNIVSQVICGGSIISPHYILTAAHCLYNTEYEGNVRYPNATHAWLGVHNRLEDRNIAKSQVINAKVESIVLHPQYFKESPWDFDFGLIRVSEEIKMSNKTRPVCLPQTPNEFDMVDDGAEGEVAGWGLYTTVSGSSYKLYQAQFPIVSTQRCEDAFIELSRQLNKTLNKGLRITERMFCAGFEAGDSHTTCEGDSGSPLVMKNTGTEKYYVMGMVSYAAADTCGKSKSYTVYAKLTQTVVEWIMEKTNNLE
uniref:AsMASPb n=1 Tax=Halocynthia roretzi TaxID=7729 RepID=O01655_HALRO|nr:AsMASPb [Halocynthia roretzi]